MNDNLLPLNQLQEKYDRILYEYNVGMENLASEHARKCRTEHTCYGYKLTKWQNTIRDAPETRWFARDRQVVMGTLCTYLVPFHDPSEGKGYSTHRFQYSIQGSEDVLEYWACTSSTCTQCRDGVDCGSSMELAIQCAIRRLLGASGQNTSPWSRKGGKGGYTRYGRSLSREETERLEWLQDTYKTVTSCEGDHR